MVSRDQPPTEHGVSGYRHGCRCPECRAANADRMRKWRRNGAVRSGAAARHDTDVCDYAAHWPWPSWKPSAGVLHTRGTPDT